MKHSIICPRTEICPIYAAYVEATGDETLGIIGVETIENRLFYSCRALVDVLERTKKGQLADRLAKRLEGSPECLLIDQANRQTPKRRADS